MNSTIVVAEKCAFEGTTRFEDGLRLPLGISVNFPSFAAGILTEVSSAGRPHHLSTLSPLFTTKIHSFNRLGATAEMWSARPDHVALAWWCLLYQTVAFVHAGGVQSQGAAAIQPPGRDGRDAGAGLFVPVGPR